MLEDCAILLPPPVLFSSIKECVFCFPDVGTVAAGAGIFVDDTGIAEEGDLIFV